MNKECQSPSFPQLLYRGKQNKPRELLNFEISKPIIKQLKLFLPRYFTDSLCSAVNIILQFVQEIRSSHLTLFPGPSSWNRRKMDISPYNKSFLIKPKFRMKFGITNISYLCRPAHSQFEAKTLVVLSSTQKFSYLEVYERKEGQQSGSLRQCPSSTRQLVLLPSPAQPAISMVHSEIRNQIPG